MVIDHFLLVVLRPESVGSKASHSDSCFSPAQKQVVKSDFCSGLAARDDLHEQVSFSALSPLIGSHDASRGIGVLYECSSKVDETKEDILLKQTIFPHYKYP